MRIVSLFLLLLAAALSGCFSGGATETETGTAQLIGEVKRTDGRPAVGARVRLRPSGFQSGGIPDSVSGGIVLGDTVTDASGRFTFHKVLVGNYQVEAVYSEIYGAAAKFEIPGKVKRYELESLILQSLLTVTGRVTFSDSSNGPAAVHVLGTEHSTISDSSTGFFTLTDMPRGVFDLKVSTRLPFFPAKDFPGKVVEGSAPIYMDDLVLDRVPKQAFVLAGGKLALAGIDGTNPVVYDNDFAANTLDNEFLWALASLGRVDLRGNIVTVVPRNPLDTGAANLPSWSREARICRLSGMRNIPEPIQGSNRKLAMAPGGRWQDIVPESNPGSRLLIAEARKASAEKPLVVVASGELTTVANAILGDPSIADKMVVFGVYNHGLNGKDSSASFIVARKCRFVEWGRDYFWAGPGPSSAPVLSNWSGARLSAIRDTSTFPPLFFADFAGLAFLAEGRAWSSGRGARVLAPPMATSLDGSSSSDFIDIPKEANDWVLMDSLFFAALANPGAYHPWPVPGTVAGVSFKAQSGATPDSIPVEGDIVAGIGAADWMEYDVEAAAEGNYDVTLRYRCDAKATLRIGVPPDSGADLDLPVGSGWVEAKIRLVLKKGAQTVRLSTASGTWHLGQLRFEPAP